MKLKKILAYSLMFATVASSMVGTETLQTEAKAKTKVKKVAIENELYGKKLYVAKGKKVALETSVDVTPNKKANKKVTIKTKNNRIAKVDKKGRILGKKLGTTKVTVTSKMNKKKKATVKVVVTNPTKKISLDENRLEMEIGETIPVKAMVSPSTKTCPYVKWKTSNEKVATVDQNGNVKAVAAGKAKVKAAAVDGTGKFATCEVIVEDISTTEQKNTDKKPNKKKTTEKKTTEDKKTEVKTTEVKPEKDPNANKEPEADPNKKPDDNDNPEITDPKEEMIDYYHITGHVVHESDVPECGDLIDEMLIFSDMEGDYQVNMVSGELPKGVEFVHDIECGNVHKYAVTGYSQEAGQFDVVFEAKDSKGNVKKQGYSFLIGDKDVVVAWSRVENKPVYQNIPFYLGTCVVGGSGDYEVSVSGKYKDKFYIEDKGVGYYAFGTIDETWEIGDYVLKFTVKDVNDPDLRATGTIKFSVEKSYSVDITTGNDHPRLYNKELNRWFKYSEWEETFIVPEGIYEVWVRDAFNNDVCLDENLLIDGKIMKVYKSIGQVKYTINCDAKDCTVKLFLKNDKGHKSREIEYHELNNKKDQIENVPEGTYQLFATLYDKWGAVCERINQEIVVEDGKGTCNIEFTTKNVDSKLNVVGTANCSEGYESINVTTIKDAYVYIKFIPEKTGLYNIKTSSLLDPRSMNNVVRDEEGNIIRDTSHYDYVNLKKGVTYYIGVSDYHDFEEGYEAALEISFIKETKEEDDE